MCATLLWAVVLAVIWVSYETLMHSITASISSEVEVIESNLVKEIDESILQSQRVLQDPSRASQTQ